ncbi:hypothetical protein BGW38_007986 [Lunasporangiospora selenospora]|uniref:Uncharacterized protein n=1 Tax=Lunasporangiospora selenospora TaxID=979761 RepID=A0A9P6FY54_9FUNG|nr:hypothetical protein BGW38_007986 [Lunasporangiospora selenospora]
MAFDVTSSDDLESKAIGEQMLKLWRKEKTALNNFWKDREPRRKLRTRNIISAAKDSSKLQKAVGRHQLRQALVELQQEQAHEQEKEQEQARKQQEQQQKGSGVFCANGTTIPSDSDDDDYSQESSTRTSFGSTGPLEGKSNIDGPGEPSSKVHGDALYIEGVNVSARLMAARSTNMSHQSVLHETHDLFEIVAQLFKADVPEVPQQDVDLIVKWALVAASQEYLDFKTMLRGSSLDLSGLAENICEVLTMNLEHEAINIPKSLGRFKLPQDRLDIPALLLAIGPLTTAKVSVA